MQATCRAIADFEDKNGRLPTVRELAQRLGVSYMVAFQRCRYYDLELPRERQRRPKGEENDRT